MNQAKEQKRSNPGDSRSLEEMPMEKKSLLVVDDEPVIVNSLARELVSAGFDVTTAAGGEEAISKINSGFFDLVTTDLNMPGLDGFQVLKAAKLRNIQTMVIILTGFGTMESAVDALRLDADDFLQKPCDIDDLLFRISNSFLKQEQLRKIALFEHDLPVCPYCKKIRNDRQGADTGSWYSLEDYFCKIKGVRVSPDSCTDCSPEQLDGHLYV